MADEVNKGLERLASDVESAQTLFAAGDDESITVARHLLLNAIRELRGLIAAIRKAQSARMSEGVGPAQKDRAPSDAAHSGIAASAAAYDAEDRRIWPES